MRRGRLAVALVSSLWALSLSPLRPARAAIFDVLPDVLRSQAMPRAPGDIGSEKPRAVVLNGFPLYLASGRTSQRVKDVLDYYQERFPGGVLKDLVGKPVAVRKEDSEAGQLMIVEVGERERAMEVMDGKRTLSSSGPLRMVYARRGGLYTEYLMVWSDRPMPMDVLQPITSGDAPGEDLPDVPRPAGALRAFSFAEPRAGYRLAMYKLPASAEQALSQAGRDLQAAGYRADEAFARVSRQKGRLVARFARGNKDVVVTARPERRDSRVTQLSYLARDLS